MKNYHVLLITLAFGVMVGAAVPSYAANETYNHVICQSGISGMPTKYHQQGVEVWGGDFFYDGMNDADWMAAQDYRSGGTGDFTCYIQKVYRAYPASVIEALKAERK